MQLTVWKPIIWIYPLLYWNINLLLNTYNFHRKFRFTFSLTVSENTQNVQFRKAKFQNFPREYVPDPPSVLPPSPLDPIFARLTLNCFGRVCYCQWIILSITLRILVTQKKMFLFFSRKGCTFRITSLKCTPPPPPPPPKKLRTRLVAF